jgi:hypothetical protein
MGLCEVATPGNAGGWDNYFLVSKINFYQSRKIPRKMGLSGFREYMRFFTCVFSSEDMAC